MPAEGPPNELGDFPVYLFNQSQFDDYRYIFNYTILTASLGVVLQEEYFNRPSIDQVNYWKNQCETDRTCKPFQSADDIRQTQATYTKQHHQLLPPKISSKLNYQAIDRYVLETVLPHCGKEVSFDLFIPPVSMNWLSQLSNEAFDYQLYLIRYLVANTATCKNVHVFAFNNEAWISGDLSRYSDDFHFFGDVQDYILMSFGRGQHIISMDNIDQFEQTFIEGANTYTPWGSTTEQLHNSQH